MRLRIQSEALEEFAASATWYLEEKQSPQSAERFTKAVEKAYRDIQEDPDRYPARKSGMRAWRLKKFPFSILYHIELDEVVVTSVYHHKRDGQDLEFR